MKNEFCDLSREQIATLPERFQGFFLSPFHLNRRNGYVLVPEDAFKEMIDLLAEYAQQEAAANPTRVALEIQSRRAMGLSISEAERDFLKLHLPEDGLTEGKG